MNLHIVELFVYYDLQLVDFVGETILNGGKNFAQNSSSYLYM
jgi:hypothetical protein